MIYCELNQCFVVLMNYMFFQFLEGLTFIVLMQ